MLVFVAVGCKSGTEPSQAPNQYAVGGTVIVYAQTGADDALIEAELLVDDEAIGTKQVFPSGTFQVLLSATKYLSSKGSHSVAVRIVRQKYTNVEYLLSGAGYAVNGKTGATTTIQFPTAARTLKAGDMVSVTVTIP
jgi:hypothetical protein